MKPKRSLFQVIAKAALVGAVGIACSWTSAVLATEPETIPLKDLPRNSRLAIWGDSITEVTLYPRFVEMYLLAAQAVRTS